MQKLHDSFLDIIAESKLYDPSEGLNDGAPVEHKNNSTGEGRLTPIPKSSERPDTRTPDIGQTNVTGNLNSLVFSFKFKLLTTLLSSSFIPC